MGRRKDAKDGVARDCCEEKCMQLSDWLTEAHDKGGRYGQAREDDLPLGRVRAEREEHRKGVAESSSDPSTEVIT